MIRPLSVLGRGLAVAAVLSAAMAVTVVATAAPLEAQANLATQGLGYPIGSQSSAARGAAGANLEFDPVSAVNPAAVAFWGRAAIHWQFEPETRRTTSPAGTGQSGANRFPVFGAGIGIGERVAIAVHFGSFLDRTWVTQFRGTQVTGPDTAGFTERSSVRGALSETKFTIGVRLPGQFRVGIAGLAYTGEHRLNVARAYDTSATLVSFTTEQSVRFAGRAMSIGAAWDPASWLGLAASARFGGRLDAVNDRQAARARGAIPDRWGVGLRAELATGLNLGLRHERVSWTSMRPLLDSPIPVADGDETAIGFEFVGGGTTRLPYALRAGYVDRALPFGLGTSGIRERGPSVGASLLLANGALSLDAAVQPLQRRAGPNVSERATLVSLGITVRP